MKRVEQAVAHIIGDISQKEIIEVACGCAEFSICAASSAAHVTCIDLEEFRLLPQVQACGNVAFQIMDATAMSYPNQTFDTVILYNAIGHLEPISEAVLGECLRILRSGGCVWIISSFQMDRHVIESSLLPLLQNRTIPYRLDADRVFTLSGNTKTVGHEI